MFENLANRLQDTFKRLRGRGKLTPREVDAALKEVRIALLEADVNFRVVKDFIAQVRERAVGVEVMKSLSPGHQVVKIVRDELARLVGGTNSRLNLGTPPAVIMLVGPQGSGKTTTTGKLALHLSKQGRRPLLVAADPYRPAAVRQLEVLAGKLGMPVVAAVPGTSVLETARGVRKRAEDLSRDVVLVDTAGRIHVDEDLMHELQQLKEILAPDDILLVVDAMTGQDAVRLAESFEKRLGLTGIILTKIDGDARGGAALSIRAVTQRPIKFIGTGEKLEALEAFHPDRMASRILGMGDVLTLIEKTQSAVGEQEARALEKKLRDDDFTLEDFREQLKQVQRMGSLKDLLGLVPGLAGNRQLQNLQVDEREFRRIEAIINSMTPAERRNASIINSSRRKRIAAGSGTTVQDVNRVLKQFEQTRKMVRQLTGLVKKGGSRSFRGLPFPWK